MMDDRRWRRRWAARNNNALAGWVEVAVISIYLPNI